MKILGYVFTTIIATIVGTIFGGYALSKLWDWFIVGVFDLPKLTILHAIGLSCVVELLAHQLDLKEDGRSAYEKFWTAIMASVLKPAFALLFGFIVHKFY